MKILSLSAAPGWFAQYKEDDGTTLEYPLVCWGLTEKKDEVDVVGFIYDRQINLVESASADNFLGYRHESEPKP